MPDLFDEPLPAREPDVHATYDYVDESGALLFQVMRMYPKDFRQRKPDRHGRWTWNLDGVRRVPYRLPAVLEAEAAGQTVYVVEGEKDVHAVEQAGEVATTNPGGASKWRDEYSSFLVGANVVVVADRDEPGYRHAHQVAESLARAGVKAMVAHTPDPSHKDVTDLLLAGGRLEDLVPVGVATEGGEEIDASPLDDRSLGGGWQRQGEVVAAMTAATTEDEVFDVLMSADPPADRLGRMRLREKLLRAIGRKLKSPARALDAWLNLPADATEGGGHRLELADPDPWPEAVDGEKLLFDLVAFIQRYIVVPAGSALTVALWVLHAHSLDAFDVSPILVVTSPTKRCGKSHLLVVVYRLALRGLFSSNITPAALFRTIEAAGPTLVIDEADTFAKLSDELRGLLNAGHARDTAAVIRTVGEEHEPRAFSTWSAKAMAAIGSLPDSIEDRAVKVRMTRRRGEQIAAFRSAQVAAEAEALQRRSYRWALDHVPALRIHDPGPPMGLNDRANDNWWPLLAIADLAGGDWPARARAAAVEVSADLDDDSLGTLLLGDIGALFAERGVDEVPTPEILAALHAMEDRPWGDWKGKPMTAHTLARQLKDFGVRPGELRSGKGNGYRLGRGLGAAIDTYTSLDPPSQSSEPPNPQVRGHVERPSAVLTEPSNRSFEPDQETAPDLHEQAPLGDSEVHEGESRGHRVYGRLEDHRLGEGRRYQNLTDAIAGSTDASCEDASFELEQIIAEYFDGLWSNLLIAYKDRYGRVPASLAEITHEELLGLVAEVVDHRQRRTAGPTRDTEPRRALWTSESG